MIMDKKIILLSGGLDSTVLAHKIKNDGDELKAIYIRFGYLSSLGELYSAKYTANILGIPLEIVNVEGLADMLAGFYPPNVIRGIEYDIRDPNEPDPFPDPRRVSGYYVLTAIASFFAQLSNYNYLDVAIIKEQVESRSGFMEFVQQWSSMINSFNSCSILNLEVPFSEFYKKDVIKLGRDLRIDMSRTWSCYGTGKNHCGVCGGCKSRKKAFFEAGVPDNTIYESVSD